ncbi:hypothetical protein D9M68_791750 [compost metagenome]
MTSPSIAWAVSSALTNSGVPGSTGRSVPSKVTCRASGRMPAFSRIRLSGMPAQRAFPMAPLPDCPPPTRGMKKPRLLPEHWVTATSSTGLPKCSFRSDSDSSSGLSTCPLTRMR